VSSLAAKGKVATVYGGAQGAEAKSFCSPSRKVFDGVYFTPCGTTHRCYDQPSARERTRDGSPEAEMRMNTPDTAKRRGVLSVRRQATNSESGAGIAGSKRMLLTLVLLMLAFRP